ncbi:Glycosyltransferase involved in cell wall bisynthesis [Algoriphagus faecimaris]|uniref:Glycosyltransferase involved in cell wall bisynthesis n=1 Tax=Algoriphagus faecimaris TaxID=686796 RepID=A0A1G6PTM0_9BACT|nr:glycosyltransferase [Algoriphagus faecimaris]SDC82737.1 Glycosyltransferase involved in cell wall bisynthesis [Algoriphagus faecimaris]
MKIARIVFELNFGGVEKVAALAAHGFQAYPDIQMQFISLGKGGKVSEDLKAREHQVWVINQTAKIPDIGLIYQLYRYFKKEKFNVVHTVGAEANFHGLLAAVMAGVRIRIGEEIGFPNHHFLYRILFRFTYLFAHQVICVSQAVMQHLNQIGELPLSKGRVLYNPVELPEVKSKKESSDNQLVFITVSRLTAIKNIRSVILALGEIIHGTDFRPKLMIVGEGEEREYLECLVGENQIEEYVSFEGYQSDVFEYLSQADVFVLPSYSEGSSLALAEAMHIGLPSVVTKIGGASEILGDSASGILIDPYYLPEIKDSMLDFLKMDFTERMEKGKRAKMQAAKFSKENYCKELLSLYNSIPV